MHYMERLAHLKKIAKTVVLSIVLIIFLTKKDQTETQAIHSETQWINVNGINNVTG